MELLQLLRYIWNWLEPSGAWPTDEHQLQIHRSMVFGAHRICGHHASDLDSKNKAIVRVILESRDMKFLLLPLPAQFVD